MIISSLLTLGWPDLKEPSAFSALQAFLSAKEISENWLWHGLCLFWPVKVQKMRYTFPVLKILSQILFFLPSPTQSLFLLTARARAITCMKREQAGNATTVLMSTISRDNKPYYKAIHPFL
jgi:hypothetical protein